MTVKNENLGAVVSTYISGHYTFFKNQEGKPCALLNQRSHIALPFRGAGSVAQMVQSEFLAEHQRPVPTAVLNEVLSAFEGVALSYAPRQVDVRFARDPDGQVIVDLGTNEGDQAIIISPDGWKTKDCPPAGIMFRRPSSMLATSAEPCSIEDSMTLSRELFCLPEDDFLRLYAWLVAACIPGIPHPVLMLLGGQGSGKTLRSRAIKTLVHPSPVLAQAEPRSVRDWISIGSASPMIVLDNVSTIQPWFSDALCRAVTGDALQSRALYSDADATVAIFQSTIVLNSIEIEGVRGDLADRSFIITCPRISRQDRKTDADMQALLHSYAPQIRGGLFTAVSYVLKNLPHVKLSEMGRLADYDKVVAALDMAVGSDVFSKAHEGVQAQALHDLLDSDPVFEALVVYMEGRQLVEIRPIELYQALMHRHIAQNVGVIPSVLMPRDGQRMTAWVRRNEESLVTFGFLITLFKDRLNQTFIRITRDV